MLRRIAHAARRTDTSTLRAFTADAASPAAQHRQTFLPEDGLTLADFISTTRRPHDPSSTPASSSSTSKPSSYSSMQPAAGSRQHLHHPQTVFIETYGCQMNVNDSEVVQSVLQSAGYVAAPSAETADVVLLNTCAIRDKAEAKIRQRLGYFKNQKLARRQAARRALLRGSESSIGGQQAKYKESIQNLHADGATNNVTVNASSASPATQGPVVGVLGCMAERLKHRLLESDRLVDLVAGPDAYRDLPRLINLLQGRSHRDLVPRGNSNKEPGTTRNSEKARAAAAGHDAGDPINVQLSADETYADVVPVRPAGMTSAFLSIMRGCNNMCSFCVVPYTRGRERSRPIASIVEEVRMLSQEGIREVTLLGQNVNSYADKSTMSAPSKPFSATVSIPTGGTDDPYAAHYARGFRSVYKPTHRNGAVSFAQLLDVVADIDPEMRIRFTSPHPKDFSDDVLEIIASRPNVCLQLHMPAQSGSTHVLERMRRGYTRAAYDDLVVKVRETLPGVALSTDLIAGFCGETEEDHQASLNLLENVVYESAFLFAYSERERTAAWRHLTDDVPEPVKSRRLRELIETYRSGLMKIAKEEVGRRHVVLVEGTSRRDQNALTGRTDTFKRVVFDDVHVPNSLRDARARGGDCDVAMVRLKPGDYVAVQIISGGSESTMKAVPLARTTLSEFVSMHGTAVPLQRHEDVGVSSQC